MNWSQTCESAAESESHSSHTSRSDDEKAVRFGLAALSQFEKLEEIESFEASVEKLDCPEEKFTPLIKLNVKINKNRKRINIKKKSLYNPGSQVSLISYSLLKKLNLRRIKTKAILQSISGKSISSNYRMVDNWRFATVCRSKNVQLDSSKQSKRATVFTVEQSSKCSSLSSLFGFNKNE